MVVGFATSLFGAPPDGLYVGTTDQGRTFEIRVSGGMVDQWLVDFSVSCGYGSASGTIQTTISPSCAVEADGTFTCGSSSCPTTGVNSRVGGQFFSDNTVTGTLELAARIGGGCCNLDTTFSASLGGGGGGTRDFDYFVAAIAHTRGVGDAVWRSKLGLLNFSGATAEVELTYLHGGEASTESVTLAHGELRTWDDAAVDLFGVTGRSSGPVFIASDQQLVITSRTYSEGEDGTFGSFLQGVGMSQTVGYGGVGVVSQLCGNDDFRTNVGVVNLSGGTCQVRVWVHGDDGVETGSPVTLILDGYGFEQVNDLFAATGSGSRDNAFAVIDVQTDGCEVWAYGSVIDGVAAFPGTNDATIVPMRRVQQSVPPPVLIVFVSADFETTHDIMGLDWIPDSRVTLTIDRDADGSTDVERTTTVGEEGDARFQPGGDDPALQVGEGDIVELSDGVTRVTYPVSYLTLDSIDRDNDILSGRAREGTLVDVGVFDSSFPFPTGIEIQILVGSSETWTVDFTGIFDIVAESTGWVSTRESVPALTSIAW